MDIYFLRFYVQDVRDWHTWFVDHLCCRVIAEINDEDQLTVVLLRQGVLILLTSPRAETSAAAQHLNHHPPGVADVGFRVNNLDTFIERTIAAGIKPLTAIQTETYPTGAWRWCQLPGWGTRHTLLECQGQTPLLPGLTFTEALTPAAIADLPSIDHVVLNVEAGDLSDAIAWYESTLGFQRKQRFTIDTLHSGLASQVLWHPAGTAQIPINQPTSANSQIQEFLDCNRGPGVQHAALATPDIVAELKLLRSRHLTFLTVPSTYYEQVKQRPGFQPNALDWAAIAEQQILVDWPPEQPQARLLQTFTQPIFNQPTFFFEIIERKQYDQDNRIQVAQGFGEGNFQALFEAMEREQEKRGSL
ncbi:MAG: 4-hydroxyphenylpyruvate dioxygenase [Cyanobacteria bacterium P01_D01_bin.128]